MVTDAGYLDDDYLWGEGFEDLSQGVNQLGVHRSIHLASGGKELSGGEFQAGKGGRYQPIAPVQNLFEIAIALPTNTASRSVAWGCRCSPARLALSNR
ncbi:MAG: hypothetical protein HC925_03210 [Coleofasciculaceae cyanobacterium SM2_3_26]|nr:hypothetical protein [Coleofasciculaceae cyanobacterium SM2_3_26]